jgi:hypothetical protein
VPNAFGIIANQHNLSRLSGKPCSLVARLSPTFQLSTDQMKTFINTLFITLSLTACFCKQPDENKISINPEWVKLNLPNGWSFYAPKSFSTKQLQGVDSEPGIITSTKDSIYLEYDSGKEMTLKREKCSFQTSFIKAKHDITGGWYKDFYKVPLVHLAYIDTIDNKIAIIVKPTKKGDGTLGISISDCETGKWLGITGTNLTIEKEKIVLEIFKTIKLTKAN